MRKIGGSLPRSFAGSLLIAHPNMLDPNFRRAVLFISVHDPEDGALGVILNRPLDKQVADLVNDEPPAGLANVPVFLGGPVGRNQLMFAAFEWQKGEHQLVSPDRKSTRLNSSHPSTSYAVYCLKKKTSKVLAKYSDG